MVAQNWLLEICYLISLNLGRQTDEMIAVVYHLCTKLWKALSSNTAKPVMNVHFSCKEMVLWHLKLSTLAYIITALQFQELIILFRQNMA